MAPAFLRRAGVVRRRPAGAARTGDIVRLDLPNRRLDMLVDEAELERRRAAWTAPEPRFERGWGYMFQRHVGQADEGCDFDFLTRAHGRAAGEPSIYWRTEMPHDLDSALGGISGILVTPYDEDGEIAPERLAPILDRALGAGVHMPVVNGNTGEFYALTTDEACTMAARSPASSATAPRSSPGSAAASATPAGLPVPRRTRARRR